MRLGLEPVPPGEMPRIARLGITVAQFEVVAVANGIRAIGAEVLAATAASIRVQFRDYRDITVEVVGP
jgi:hypothetical protein